MKTSTFNINRFWLLLKKDMILNGSIYLIQLLFMVLALSIFTIILIQTNGYDFKRVTESTDTFYFITLYLFLVLFHFGLFKFYGNTSKTIDFITTPSSIVEKYLYPIFKNLLFIIVFNLLFFLTYNIINLIYFNQVDYSNIFDVDYLKENSNGILISVLIGMSLIFPITKLSSLIFKKFKRIASIIIFLFISKNYVDESLFFYVGVTIIIVLEVLIFIRLKKIQP